MAQPAKGQEPSMEEILASIRRIIADDDATKAPSKPPDPVAQQPAQMAPPPAPPAPPRSVVPPETELMQAEIDAIVARQTQPPVPTTDILDLTEAMAAPTPMVAQAPGFRTIDGQSDLVFGEIAEEEPPAEAVPPPESAPARQPIDPQLISRATSAAVDSAFNSLAHTVLVQNARTLEDLVREMLRPMLKTWLDDNLPGLVERLVRSEIDRVSRGRN